MSFVSVSMLYLSHDGIVFLSNMRCLEDCLAEIAIFFLQARKRCTTFAKRWLFQLSQGMAGWPVSNLRICAGFHMSHAASNCSPLLHWLSSRCHVKSMMSQHVTELSTGFLSKLRKKKKKKKKTLANYHQVINHQRRNFRNKAVLCHWPCG